jgi:hypothetical protein
MIHSCSNVGVRAGSGAESRTCITRRRAIAALTTAAIAAGLATIGAPASSVADEPDGARSLDGRVVALGIPGASAISPVGTFLPGSPINSNPQLAALTQPGRVLDPTRIVVGSRSNFGAPVARECGRPGSATASAG